MCVCGGVWVCDVCAGKEGGGGEGTSVCVCSCVYVRA